MTVADTEAAPSRLVLDEVAVGPSALRQREHAIVRAASDATHHGVHLAARIRAQRLLGVGTRARHVFELQARYATP
jgi:hypothetical protein